MADYLTIDEARRAPGLRLVGIRGVPSPWTEAARGIFHVKRLPCRYAARGADEPADALALWAGDSGIPVVAWNDEPLRTGWAEILLLAERLAPDPSLIPAEPERRAELFGVAHEICGEMGLGWCVRLLMIARSQEPASASGFPPEIAARLAAKYGYSDRAAGEARTRVLDVLGMLDARLARQPWILGDAFSAADIYWATFANLLTPLPADLLPAFAMIRDVYAGSDADIVGAVSDRLRRHQRDVYERHLELPVPL